MSYDMTCVCTPSTGLSATLTGLRSSLNSLTGRVTDTEERLDAFSIIEHGHVVSTQEELEATVAIGMPAWVSGSIEFEGENQDIGGGTISAIGLDVNVDETKIHGLSNGVTNGRLVLPYAAGANASVINVRARNCELRNLEITSNHPLTAPGPFGYDMGVRVSSWPTHDSSGLVIDGCDIHDVWNPIQRGGNTSSMTLDRIRIINNNLHSFSGYGINFDWRTRHLLVDANRIWGRDSGEAHATLNGIWVGDFADFAIISRNEVANVDRHGIEYYNTDVAANLTGNLNGQILNNIVRDCLYGVSVVGNGGLIVAGNHVTRAKGIGIEFSNDAGNFGQGILANNFVDDTLADPNGTSETLGISLDKVTGVLVQGNVVRKLTSPGVLESFGLQVIHGGLDIDIRGNRLLDAGTQMLCVNGDAVFVYNRINIENNTFRYSSAYMAAYPSPTYGAWPAIRCTNIVAAVVKDNTVWYPTAGPTLGTMELLGVAGTVYSGHVGDPALVSPATIAQSNQRIAY